MTSYFSSFTSSTAISNLSTRFTSLRRVLASDETDDPDNEDNSHLSNVLRAYYTEKGRRFPAWLPPDPKSPQPPPPTVVTQTSFQAYSQTSTGPAGRGRGGLGDLWGDPAPSSALPMQPQQTSSLRLGCGGNPTPPPLGAAPGFRPSVSSLPGRPSPSGSPRRPFDRTQSASPAHTQRGPGPMQGGRGGGARPLPSQMAGSYQTTQAAQSRPAPDRTPSAASAQERLRARLHGSGGPSPYGNGTRSPLTGPR